MHVSGARIYTFWVQFNDKKASSYSLAKPQEFLTEKSLKRRAKAGVMLRETDLPVCPVYEEAVLKNGFAVRLTSRWFNAALVETQDSAAIGKLDLLPFTGKILFVESRNPSRGASYSEANAPFGLGRSARVEILNDRSEYSLSNRYGESARQIEMLNGHIFHEAGYDGRGVLIAVMDAGFYRANQMEAFDSVFKNGQVKGHYDFADLEEDVFDDDDHGTEVWSCMAANVPGLMIGTAPGADYLLLRTEIASRESLVEEFNWIAGAEYADAQGADMISSSLGYTEFDNPAQGHVYEDLDGNTTWISKAANMAARTGMIMVNSAGNEGDMEWKYIGAPADAENVIAVAAVDAIGERASFSSYGPTAAGRNKPDIAAMGERTTVAATGGYVHQASGTSYSAPVLAGFIACMIQYMGNTPPEKLKQVLFMSCGNFFAPDNSTGYGIPDARHIMYMHVYDDNAPLVQPFFAWIKGDTVRGGLDIKTMRRPDGKYFFELSTEEGGHVMSGTLNALGETGHGMRLDAVHTGRYKLKISDGLKKWEKSFYFAADPL
jgi:hypothetical protein